MGGGEVSDQWIPAPHTGITEIVATVYILHLIEQLRVCAILQGNEWDWSLRYIAR